MQYGIFSFATSRQNSKIHNLKPPSSARNGCNSLANRPSGSSLSSSKPKHLFTSIAHSQDQNRSQQSSNQYTQNQLNPRQNQASPAQQRLKFPQSKENFSYNCHRFSTTGEIGPRFNFVQKKMLKGKIAELELKNEQLEKCLEKSTSLFSRKFRMAAEQIQRLNEVLDKKTKQIKSLKEKPQYQLIKQNEQLQKIIDCLTQENGGSQKAQLAMECGHEKFQTAKQSTRQRIPALKTEVQSQIQITNLIGKLELQNTKIDRATNSNQSFQSIRRKCQAKNEEIAILEFKVASIQSEVVFLKTKFQSLLLESQMNSLAQKGFTEQVYQDQHSYSKFFNV